MSALPLSSPSYLPLALLLLAASACGEDDATSTAPGTGTGTGGGVSGGGGLFGNPMAGLPGTGGALAGTGASAGSGAQMGTGGEGAGCEDALVLTMRDFTETHADFEAYTQAVTGIVLPDLGADKKPVYAHAGGTGATTGPAEFDQWYRDVDGVNMRIEVPIDFTETSPGVFVYDNSQFFPLDNMGFGNGPLPAGILHNYLFTTEAHTLFTYGGGEVFTFRGDDDLWIFINDRLAVDLGGTHSPLAQTIRLDDLRAQLGIEVGQTYAMDIFHAERHTIESNFRIETTIDLSCIENVDVDPQ